MRHPRRGHRERPDVGQDDDAGSFGFDVTGTEEVEVTATFYGADPDGPKATVRVQPTTPEVALTLERGAELLVRFDPPIQHGFGIKLGRDGTDAGSFVPDGIVSVMDERLPAASAASP